MTAFLLSCPRSQISGFCLSGASASDSWRIQQTAGQWVSLPHPPVCCYGLKTELVTALSELWATSSRAASVLFRHSKLLHFVEIEQATVDRGKDVWSREQRRSLYQYCRRHKITNAVVTWHLWW